MHKTKRTETKIHFRIKYFPQLDSVSPHKESDKKHFYVETPFGFLKIAKFIDASFQVGLMWESFDMTMSICSSSLWFCWKGEKKYIINSLESEVQRINFVQLKQKKYDLFLCK